MTGVPPAPNDAADLSRPFPASRVPPPPRPTPYASPLSAHPGMPAWPQQQGYSVEPQVAQSRPPQPQPQPQSQQGVPIPAGYSQPGQMPLTGYPAANTPAMTHPAQPQGYPPNMPFAPQPYSPQPYSPQQFSQQPYPPLQFPQQPYPPNGNPSQPGYGFAALGYPPTGYPTPQIIYVQSIGYPPQQAAQAPPESSVGHASWETDDNGFGEMPDMPGGWYQPPSAAELTAMNSGGPPVPVGGGAGAGVSYAHHFVAGTPSGDPLVSHDFGSWISKTAGAFVRSLLGLVSVNVFGLALTFVVSWLAAVALRIGVGMNNTVYADVRSAIVPGLTVLLGTGMVFMMGISATQAASAYVVVADAHEGKSRVRLFKALAFGIGAIPRLFWGLFSTMCLTVLFVVLGTLLNLVVVAPALASVDGTIGLVARLVATLAVVGPPVYLLVVTQTSMVGVASFESSGILGVCRGRIRGQWWSMLVRGLVVGAVIMGANFVAQNAFNASDFIRTTSDAAGATGQGNPSALALMFVLYVLAMCIQAPAQLVSYAELRSHVDGPAITPMLAKKARIEL